MDVPISKEMISELTYAQQEAFAAGVPIIIVFEGSSGRAIGRVINEVNRCLEPRGVKYHHFIPSDSDGPLSQLDFIAEGPAKGSIALYDRSWYSMIIDRYDGDKEGMDRMLYFSSSLERYFVNNGILLIKIMLRATPEAIKKYVPEYGPENKGDRSFISMDHIDPVKYRAVMWDSLFTKTNTNINPWDTVEVREVSKTVEETVEIIIKRIWNRIEEGVPKNRLPKVDKCVNPRKGLHLDKKIDEYEKKIDALTERLSELQLILAESQRSLVICFEGWDAAGKGSAIKHVCHALNPRGYSVRQVKAPTDIENSHSFIWRFCADVPKRGHISIFDRSWYGRMMVEPIEGFCTEREYARAPSEINVFEEILTASGAIVMKFWLDISPEEQLRRFEKRKADPLKQWKLTDDDWRNREKWSLYDRYVDTMMETTNTKKAPWTVVESDNKKFARVKVLRTIVDRLETELVKTSKEDK